MKMYIMTDLRTKEVEIDTETGYINGSSQWIFKGLHHVKRNDFIPRKDINQKLLDDMRVNGSLWYKNGKCQYTVIDIDHGTTRMWGNRPTYITLHN